MTPEELLRPRYKVIADYPSSPFTLNQVINFKQSRNGELLYEWAEHDGLHDMNKWEFDDYPSIFKKLEWWEERKEDEVPEFVKYNSNVYKVADKSQNGRIHHKPNEIEHRFIWPKASGYMPATKEEFEAQKQ